MFLDDFVVQARPAELLLLLFVFCKKTFAGDVVRGAAPAAGDGRVLGSRGGIPDPHRRVVLTLLHSSAAGNAYQIELSHFCVGNSLCAAVVVGWVCSLG